MRRREFFGVLGGAVAAGPHIARAQQGEQIRRIGILFGASLAPMGPLREELRKLGYVEGQNVQFEIRSAGPRAGQLPELAADLVHNKVDIIVAVLTPSVTAAKNATSKIPIVMAPAGNPVGTGLIASLARPGGNITGAAGTGPEMGVKNLELIRDVVPTASRVAVLANATDPFTPGYLDQLEQAARLLRLELRTHMIRATDDFEPVFAAIVREGSAGVLIQGSLPARPTVDLAIKHRLPALGNQKLVADAGALMSYSASYEERARTVAAYVDKILKGARPADLPVQQPTKYDLTINLKTAKAIGLTLSPTLLARADEVIE